MSDACNVPLSISYGPEDFNLFGQWCMDCRLYFIVVFFSLSVCIGSFRLDRRVPRPSNNWIHIIYLHICTHDMYIYETAPDGVASLAFWDPDFQIKSKQLLRRVDYFQDLSLIGFEL